MIYREILGTERLRKSNITKNQHVYFVFRRYEARPNTSCNIVSAGIHFSLDITSPLLIAVKCKIQIQINRPAAAAGSMGLRRPGAVPGFSSFSHR